MAEIADIGVQKGAGYAGEDVKFTDVLGNSINNLQFSQGWLHATENPAAPDAYVWTALSACGDVLADTVYQNVRNYVDLAANVETCKVKALLSMLKEMGLDFMFGQTFSDVPLKLMNMLDAYSVDRKYLFASGVLSPTTVMHVLSAAGAKYAGPDYVSPAWTSAATWENLSASLSTAGIDETTWCISAIGLDGEELQGLSGEIPKYWTDGGGWSVLSGCLTAYSVDETKWNEAYGGISAYMDPGDIGDGTPR